MKDFFKLCIKGIVVGVANIIPGVSGGTIAVVLNIFDELINSINNLFKKPIKSLKFLSPIFLGALAGIGVFSKIVETLLLKFSLPTNMFFVGLVLGSVPLIYKQTKTRDFKKWYYLVSLVSFLFVVFISLISTAERETYFEVNFLNILKILTYGGISSSAMVIPGISGSFVMVLLGIYNTIIISISEFLKILVESFSLISTEGIFCVVARVFTAESFIILASLGAGVLLGILFISKIIAILFKKAFSLTYFAILGLIFGSVFSIFSDASIYQSYTNGVPLHSVFTGILTFVIGFFISIKFSK